MLAPGGPSGHTCLACSNDVTDTPIGGSVGLGGRNQRDDVRTVQRYLNSLSSMEGGPAMVLAEDGICGPKTQAAITKYQNFAMGWADGRIDPAGKTIKALTGYICTSPTVPPGQLGKPAAAANTPNTAPPPPNSLGADSIAVAHICLRVVEPRLGTLRWRLTRTTTAMRALLDKHFSTGKDKVSDADIAHVNSILGRVHSNMARANAFGKMPFENIILFDPGPPDNNIAFTVRGGDKLSTSQFQIYRDKGVDKKFPGQSIWLTTLFADQPTEEKHWTVIHEFCHYVGPRDGNFNIVTDYGYAFENHFLTLPKFKKLHNAESLALFFLEWCFGTERVTNLPRLNSFKAHFSGFPKVVVPGGEIVTS